MLKNSFIPALKIFIASSIICGVLYTGVVTLVGNVCFPHQANGSIIEVDGVVYGSELLSQQFNDDDHMWGRAENIDVDSCRDSNGNRVVYAQPVNMSPATDAYSQVVQDRIQMIRDHNPQMSREPIPVDLVTCSGSGLDPNISLAAAKYQIPRIAQASGKSETEIEEIVEACTVKPLFGLFGQPYVNVLEVNLMLEGIL